MSENYGWVAMHKDGPWHEATEPPIFLIDEAALNQEVVCEVDRLGGPHPLWEFWHKRRPPHKQMCKNCLRAKERGRDG